MKTKLFFLVADESAAKTIVDDLRKEKVPDEDIYAVAKRESYPLDDDIPEAGILQTSDLAPAAKRGAVAGSSAGLLAGLIAVPFMPLGIVAAGGAIAALTAAGAITGTWASTLIGVSVTNSDIKQFEDGLDAGQILMLVSVDEDKTDNIEAILRQSHPDAVIQSGKLDT